MSEFGIIGPNDRAYMVLLDDLVPNPFNPRRVLDEKAVGELAASISSTIG